MGLCPKLHLEFSLSIFGFEYCASPRLVKIISGSPRFLEVDALTSDRIYLTSMVDVTFDHNEFVGKNRLFGM